MIIGLQDSRFWREGKFMNTFFRKAMQILIYNGADVDYAEKCVRDFNSPSDELLNKIYSGLLLHCIDSLNKWAEIDKRDEIEAKLNMEISPFMDASKLVKCLTPANLSVRESPDGEIGWQAEFDCLWEPEKGIEIVVLGGELLYLGSFCDNSPWDEFPADDMSNYVNRIFK
ncbi:MAG: hypothetical protein II656_07075 [Ruminococcus sp.]|nr:hypothetical protein [Ruminococcus sp.]